MKRMHLVSNNVSACWVSNQIHTMLSRFWGIQYCAVISFSACHHTSSSSWYTGPWCLCQIQGHKEKKPSCIASDSLSPSVSLPVDADKICHRHLQTGFSKVNSNFSGWVIEVSLECSQPYDKGYYYHVILRQQSKKKISFCSELQYLFFVLCLRSWRMPKRSV